MLGNNENKKVYGPTSDHVAVEHANMDNNV